jgi:hypothetical protein
MLQDDSRLTCCAFGNEKADRENQPLGNAGFKNRNLSPRRGAHARKFSQVLSRLVHGVPAYEICANETSPHPASGCSGGAC